MRHDFDEGYWQAHWQNVDSSAAAPPNPYLIREAGSLRPGTALDAGCGEGAEALWLGGGGWAVTAVDISGHALDRAKERAVARGLGEDAVRWVQADLGTWQPSERFDLVITHYAHPAMPQLDFYDRLSEWVAPGGSLLVVGHLHDAGHGGDHGGVHGERHEHSPPAEASVTAAAITARLDPARWDVVTSEEQSRSVETRGGPRVLHDVVVRAVSSAD